MEGKNLEEVFSKQAGMYGRLQSKKRSIDHNWRKELLSFAKGKILEVSVGAGANFKFYESNANVTAVDLSPEMIEEAKKAASTYGVNAKFIVSKVEDLDFQIDTFDTIVSTFSLCAYNDPLAVLSKFDHWCKKGGMILLLEHGISKYGFFRFLQNNLDKYQYSKMGCHANRDIMSILKNSELQIKMYERKLAGIICMIWATPFKDD